MGTVFLSSLDARVTAVIDQESGTDVQINRLRYPTGLEKLVLRYVKKKVKSRTSNNLQPIYEIRKWVCVLE
jgi:hypothetical protein